MTLFEAIPYLDEFYWDYYDRPYDDGPVDMEAFEWWYQREQERKEELWEKDRFRRKIDWSKEKSIIF